MLHFSPLLMQRGAIALARAANAQNGKHPQEKQQDKNEFW
jgi:hypothetical protein